MPIRVLCVLLVLTACSTAIPIRFGTHARSAPIVAFSNPSFADGDPIAGRRAFITLQCIACHRVASDPNLPRGARAIAGPILSDLARYSSNDLAKRITSRSTGTDEEFFGRTMKDYAQPMTARNLVDVVAYLRNTKAGPAEK
jgi:cytochrome c553